jgi:hypothetical protein
VAEHYDIPLVYRQLSCCAFVEIGDLKFQKGPKEALLNLCKKAYTKRDYDHYPVIETEDLTLKPSGFYLFTAHVAYKNGRKPRKWSYGFDLAEYIRLKKLGTVTQSTESTNFRNEPSHKVIGWIWATDPKRLLKWYKANKPTEAKV